MSCATIVVRTKQLKSQRCCGYGRLIDAGLFRLTPVVIVLKEFLKNQIIIYRPI